MHHKEATRKQREEHILRSLKRFDYLTRGQIQAIHDLKSDRNAQRVLKQMEDYVNILKDGENIYYLNSKGREIANCEKIRKSTGNIQHFIMRNHLYIACGCPQNWRNEIRIKSEGRTKKENIVCVADALFTKGDAYTIVEVDNTQKMKKNQLKIEKYRELKQRGTFGFMAPTFLWITTSEYRRKELLKLSHGLNTQVFLLSELTN
ncbi:MULTISPECIES: replication-relaxation family protein [Peribacillus]|uniref:replication-relaxation family protein n=1 Tax=Peribacillus TaxID=2675229 RepID=UPI001F4ECA19|nr:replication-relaxation family protein [Peribacillus sp. Aquil_B1]MCK2007158.1 replication-relaxation family protein [Peribacillus sp. Aquil_B8]